MQRGWDDHPTLFFLAMFSTFISEFVEALRILWLNGLMLGADIVSVLCSWRFQWPLLPLLLRLAAPLLP